MAKHIASELRVLFGLPKAESGRPPDSKTKVDQLVCCANADEAKEPQNQRTKESTGTLFFDAILTAHGCPGPWHGVLAPSGPREHHWLFPHASVLAGHRAQTCVATHQFSRSQRTWHQTNRCIVGRPRPCASMHHQLSFHCPVYAHDCSQLHDSGIG
jgi:hypothetical protein